MNKIKATIIILDYLKASKVVENIESLYEQKVDFNFKVIVIDNSCDHKNAVVLKQLEGRRNLKIIINIVNLGYTKAHNAVKSDIEGDYVLIVNPDIRWPSDDGLQRLIDFMDKHQEVGVLGPKQIDDQGNIAVTARAFPRFFVQVVRRTFMRYLSPFNKMVARDEMQHLDNKKAQEVDWLHSSFLIIRKNLWDVVGGLCQNYFLFMSDVEFCWQAWKRGHKVVYYPEVEVSEDGQRLSQGGFIKFFQSWILRQHVKDSLKFRIKHLLEANPRIRFYSKQKYNRNK